MRADCAEIDGEMSKPAEHLVLTGSWLTLTEASEILHRSPSTIDRMVAADEIPTRLEPRPGRKPERLYDEKTVRELAAKQQKAPRNPRPAGPPAARPPMQLAVQRDTITALRDVITEWGNDREKLVLTVKEASRTGFSMAFLRRKCEDGSLKFFRDGRTIKIPRQELERLANT
jgi:excisionase family DNA binding protein